MIKHWGFVGVVEVNRHPFVRLERQLVGDREINIERQTYIRNHGMIALGLVYAFATVWVKS